MEKPPLSPEEADAAAGAAAARPPAVDVLDTLEAGATAIRGSALRMAGYAAGILLALAAAPLLIRHLGVVDFGRYVLVISLISIAGGLAEGGLTAIGIREYTVREGAERERLMRNLLGVRLVLTTFGCVLATLFAVVAGYDRTLILGTMVAGAGLVFQTQQTLLSVPLAARLNLGWITALDLLRQATTTVVIVALVVVGASLLPFFAVSIASGLVVLALTAWLVRRAMPFRPSFDLSEWRPLLRDALPYAAAIALNVAYFRIAIIVMSLVSTELETGYFATSYRIVEVVLAVPALLIGSVFPVLARAARDDLQRLAYAVGRVFEVGIILGAWVALSMALSAQFVIDVIAGSESQPSVAVLRIQGLAVAATFVVMACGFPLLSLRQHREILIANAIALTVSAALLLTLVPAHEARGAAVATVGAEVSLALASAIFLARSSREIRLPLGILPWVLLATAAGAAVALVPGLHDMLRVAIATVVYFGLLKLFGRIPSEILDAWRLRRATGEEQS